MNNFPGGSEIKDLPAVWETWVRSLGSIPGSGRSPGEGNSCQIFPWTEDPGGL